jgi:hypothetical protein
MKMRTELITELELDTAIQHLNGVRLGILKHIDSRDDKKADYLDIIQWLNLLPLSASWSLGILTSCNMIRNIGKFHDRYVIYELTDLGKKIVELAKECEKSEN